MGPRFAGTHIQIGGDKMTYHRCRKGVALLLSMIVLAILSAWAVSICSMSGVNVQLAENQRKVNHARASAESGLDILRFWLDQVSMPGTTAASEKFSNLVTFLQNNLTANITSNYDGFSLITILPVTLESTAGQTFSAKIIADNPLDAEILQVDVTGTYGTITRTIRVNYNFGPRMNPLFQYGIATKGPLHLAGNIELGGVNVAVESSVYIESENENEALSIIGNSQIAGDVSITNPDAYVTLQGGQAGIGGETGQEAIDNHVSVGDELIGFPVPNPGYFQQYVQNDIDTNDVVFENIRIPADTNPTFSSGITLKGLVFIEPPNIVTFTGHVNITGIIVGDGDVSDDSGTNQILFLGSVTSSPVSDLPLEPQFEQLREEPGTFLLAPGFSVSFGGNFETLNGVIAANGIEFFGDAGGTINGTAINYSDTAMNLTGNSDLSFNSGAVEVPAGFEFDIELKYDPASYSEVPL
jgi:Tfp pilus assembly protein PilX